MSNNVAFITGICGFSGSHLAEFIVNNVPEIQVFGISRPNTSRDNISHMAKRFTVFDGDLTDYNSILNSLLEVKPQYIFHIASNVRVQYSFQNPVSCLLDNCFGTVNLFEAIKLVKKIDPLFDPIIHVCSSSEVYGKVLDNELPIKENNPLRPSSPYAVSKVYQDMLAYQYFLSSGLKVIISRAFSHTGIRRSSLFAVSNFSQQIAKIKLGIQDPEIFVGNLDSVRTFCDVRDIARAYWMLVTQCKYGEVYNICGNYTDTMRSILNSLIEISGLSNIKITVDPKKIRPADVVLQVPNCDKFKKETGWEPIIDFNETMRDLLQYWEMKIASSINLSKN